MDVFISFVCDLHHIDIALFLFYVIINTNFYWVFYAFFMTIIMFFFTFNRFICTLIF